MFTNQLKRVHCIGIGGIGVSAVAELLLSRGITVSGSDVQPNDQTKRLQRLGVVISATHDAGNIAGADCVIYSSAVGHANAEYIAAEQQHIPLISRGAALAQLMNTDKVITIAGTHGKTTTTSLIAHVLKKAGLDPSYVIGGIMNSDLSPLHVGCGEKHYFIAEVDESDASFLYMRPLYAIVTNIDADHLEAYGGNFSVLQQSFVDYLTHIPSHGAAIVCIDDPVIVALIPHIRCHLITYGFSDLANVRATGYEQHARMSRFNVRIDQTPACAVALPLSGRHNVQNALAAIALAHELGVAWADIVESLAHFPGVGRRFDHHGSMKLAHGSATILEDYGHHPREIKVTLDAARMTWPDRRIVVVFQPHRYTRTRDLHHDFVAVLQEVDQLFLLDIYSAGECPLDSVTSRALLIAVAADAKACPFYVPDLASLPGMLREHLQDGDIVILQGAGDIGSVARSLVVA